MKVTVLSALRTGRIYFQEISLVNVSVRGWVEPKAILRPQWFRQWKMTVTPSGKHSPTFPNVAQCHNKPRIVTVYLRECQCMDVFLFLPYKWTQAPLLSSFLYPWTINSPLFFLSSPIFSPRVETTLVQAHRRYHSPFWSFFALLPTSFSHILYIFSFLLVYRTGLLSHRMSQLYILLSWYNYTLGTGWCVMLVCWKKWFGSETS